MTEPKHVAEYIYIDHGYLAKCRCGWEHWGSNRMHATDFFAEHVCDVLGWHRDDEEAQ